MFTANFISIIAVSLLNIVICWAWFSPWAFGRRWMELSGVSEMSMDLVGIGMGFLAFMARAYALAVVLNFAHVMTMYEGALIGVFVALGFFVSALIGEMIHEKKPYRLMVIRGGYYVVSFMIAGAILGIWR